MSTISVSTTSTTAYKVTADTTGTLVLQTGATPTTAVTIDGSQNVGIGTTPGYALDVYRASGAASYIVGENGGGCKTAIGVAGDNGSLLGTLSAHNLRLVTGGAVAATIDTSGNLLVGTTSTGYTSINAVTIEKSTNGRILISHASGTGSGSYYSGFAYAGSEVGSITQNGTTGVLYNLTSDYRLKNNQQPLTGAKEFVMALQPKKWEWWDGSGEGVGFIAHEFMEVAKYSGHGEKDAVDEEGNIIAQSIQPSSSEVMANLVAFIQELKAELDAAKADIATLKGAA